jgi:membrane protein implicated in regulation of membrane protease activity
VAAASRGPTRRTVARYAAFQLPGWAIAGTLAALAVHWGLVAPAVAIAVVALLVAKDAVLFPFVWRAYQHDGPAHGAVGERGRADGAIDGEGWVRIGPELWRARLRPGAAPIAPRTPVRVVAVDGLVLVVEADPDATP